MVNAIPGSAKSVRLQPGIRVHLQPGISFGITPETAFTLSPESRSRCPGLRIRRKQGFLNSVHPEFPTLSWAPSNSGALRLARHVPVLDVDWQVDRIRAAKRIGSVYKEVQFPRVVAARPRSIAEGTAVETWHLEVDLIQARIERGLSDIERLEIRTRWIRVAICGGTYR